ncbi:MAG: hypothetical protein COA84_14180 [Robiginitomaculum sp.]|nr:MAG: hypothetical protein COA84_14180 [Robiginitomaculum sp.]
MGFEDQLDLFAFWLRNGKCISAREASGLNQGLSIQSGENKGERKKGTCGLFLSDHIEYINRIYENDITIKQRQVFDIEYGTKDIDGIFHNQIERADELGLSLAAYRDRLFRCRTVFSNQLSK